MSQRYSPIDRFTAFSPGAIIPSGWLRAEMQRDLDGFVGHLDSLVPDLMLDPIYGSGRLHKHSAHKALGNLKEGDAEGEEQYKWWNSETQCNWLDGYLRHVYLLQDENGMRRAGSLVQQLMDTQDPDGYLGIYAEELRFACTTENGELWAKTTACRCLLAYYAFTNDESALRAVERAVDNVMQHFPMHKSSPFSSGNQFNGGVSHGLTFTDILASLYAITHREIYLEYADFLYTDYSNTYQSECDAQSGNIEDENYALRCHGVHTFEHIRSLIIAAGVNAERTVLLDKYLDKIRTVITVSGGAIGDEWIYGRKADSTDTGYEFCSLHELVHSYGLLLQRKGTAQIADAIERTFFNAAQGARHPEHSCIAYLKTDNAYTMDGTKNGVAEHNRTQTRYKYSPAHQDVAVCCAPNAGRIAPYCLQSAWLREGDDTLVAAVLLPCVLNTRMNDTQICISNETKYPYDLQFNFRIACERRIAFTIKIRKPEWVKEIITREHYTLQDEFICVHRVFEMDDNIAITFIAEVVVNKDARGAYYFQHGPLVYARPIPAIEKKGKVYAARFSDYTYLPVDDTLYRFCDAHEAVYADNCISVRLRNMQSDTIESVQLIPIGKTILRQTTFKRID